jgi:putative membrane protein insertion efficiency factor
MSFLSITCHIILLLLSTHFLHHGNGCKLCFRKIVKNIHATSLKRVVSSTTNPCLLAVKSSNTYLTCNPIQTLKPSVLLEYHVLNTKKESNYSNVVKSSLLYLIGVYRSYISPILPPNCRFVPSCSIYAIEAINQFGVIKGCILTVWRLFRCNPIGGSGYDPPQWPPPPYIK